jgi:hypothetical protein
MELQGVRRLSKQSCPGRQKGQPQSCGGAEMHIRSAEIVQSHHAPTRSLFNVQDQARLLVQCLQWILSEGVGLQSSAHGERQSCACEVSRSPGLFGDHWLRKVSCVPAPETSSLFWEKWPMSGSRYRVADGKVNLLHWTGCGDRSLAADMGQNASSHSIVFLL